MFTLLKGVDRDPWGMGVFDIDLLTLLTGYLFLSFGHIQAGAFALGQGLLIDIFSSGPNGLSALICVSVFLVIHLGSLFFNLQTAKGQIIIVSLAVFVKHATWQTVAACLFGGPLFPAGALWAAAFSIIGTGLLAPLLYSIFDRLRGIPGGAEEAPDLENLKESTWESDRY